MIEEDKTKAPSEIKSALRFKDKDGWTYVLSPTTYKHIKRDHCINDPRSFIKDTLLTPIAIVEDKTRCDRWLYHKDLKSKLYKVVVVCITDRKIKTAFLTDKIKGGKVKWVDKQNLIG